MASVAVTGAEGCRPVEAKPRSQWQARSEGVRQVRRWTSQASLVAVERGVARLYVDRWGTRTKPGRAIAESRIQIRTVGEWAVMPPSNLCGDNLDEPARLWRDAVNVDRQVMMEEIVWFLDPRQVLCAAERRSVHVKSNCAARFDVSTRFSMVARFRGLCTVLLRSPVPKPACAQTGGAQYRSVRLVEDQKVFFVHLVGKQQAYARVSQSCLPQANGTWVVQTLMPSNT